ncbi:MAG: TonB-dependent receptor [Gammaproteobacteria bacterium]|nr:TonB-dependent receptor [Gammaproteobacteria bacterium]
MSMSSSKAQQLSVRLAIAVICASAGAVHTSAALAATAASDATTDASALDEVIVTGSRQSGLKASDSPAPIQIVSADALKQAGAPDLMSALSQLVPSLQMQAFGFDMAGQTLQARLRGVSPNDVLVLINGKRRHTTANLAVDTGSPFQGGAGVDLNFVPLDAIDHVEVLTEGAAAQYGTDAIAGVVNIILKKNTSGGSLAGTYGQYGNGGGGRTEDISGNAGFEAGTGGYFNLTGEFRNHGHSNVGAIDPRLYPNTPTTYPDSNVANAPGYPYLNRIAGDAAVQQKMMAVNSGFNFDGGTEVYFFGTYGHKNAASYENYRMPSKVQYTDPVTGVTTYPFPYGFNPQEASDENDYQLNLGVKGTIASWDWDLATGLGGDKVGISTIDSYNAGTFAANGIPTPTNFYDGFLQATQWTSTADFRRDFDVGFAGPLNVAFGAEYRRETYSIGAGVPLSYEVGGAQSYPGFTPLNAGSHDRKNYAGYLDLAAKPVEALRIDAAVRFEHYSDFGNATVGKLTGRYDFSPEFAIRGTVNNGFRAPTLAEEYYSSTNVGPSTAYIQLPPNSAAAGALGLGTGLHPEKSIDYSLGFVWRPIPHMSTTLDLYQITITNRIVGSGQVAGQVNGVAQPGGAAIGNAIAIYSAGSAVIDPSVLKSGTYGINIFANGIDTRTRGADLVFDFPFDYNFGSVNWSIGATYNDTTITKYGTTPAALVPNVLYDQEAYSELTTATPKYVVNLGALVTVEKLTVNLVEKIYGPSSDYENDDGDNPSNTLQFFKDQIGVTAITNLDVGYQFTDHLKLSVGAQNLFNRFPNKLNGTILGREQAAGDYTNVSQYPIFSPFGINGGFYYAKALYKF